MVTNGVAGSSPAAGVDSPVVGSALWVMAGRVSESLLTWTGAADKQTDKQQ